MTEIIIQYFNDLKSIRRYRNPDIITSRLSEKGYTVSPVDSTVEGLILSLSRQNLHFTFFKSEQDHLISFNPAFSLLVFENTRDYTCDPVEEEKEGYFAISNFDEDPSFYQTEFLPEIKLIFDNLYVFFKTINSSYKNFTARLYIHNYELLADMEKNLLHDSVEALDHKTTVRRI